MPTPAVLRYSMVCVLCAVAAPLAAQTKQPAVSPAALAKLAEPWPTPDEMEVRRIAAERRPLFAGTDAFPFTLAADFKTINKDRRVEGKVPYPALLTIPGADGPRTLHVRLKTRGHFRLRATS